MGQLKGKVRRLREKMEWGQEDLAREIGGSLLDMIKILIGSDL